MIYYKLKQTNKQTELTPSEAYDTKRINVGLKSESTF